MTFCIFGQTLSMNKSRFSKEEKLSILGEKELLSLSVEEICVKHRISIPTYYNWKRALKPNLTNASVQPVDLNIENKTLRRLYIDLSEHNYQLAQFLNQ